MSNIHHTLTDFGLSHHEIQVYLTVLKLGNAKAQTIAEHTQIKRSSIYQYLNALEKRGIIHSTQINSVNHYIPERPNKLLEITKNRENNLKEALPELNEYFSSSQKKTPDTQHFTGRAGLIAMYEDILTTKNKMFYYMASFKENYDLIGMDYMIEWSKRRIKLKIDHKGLRAPDRKKHNSEYPDEFAEQGPKYYREYRYLPDEVKLPTRIYMYDNKTAIMSMRGENWGIIIHSKDYHDSMLHLFWNLWHQSSKE